MNHQGTKGDGGDARTVTGQPIHTTLLPVRGIPNAVEILEKLSVAHESGFPNIVFFTRPTLYDNTWEGEPVITEFNSNATDSLPDILRVMMRSSRG